MPKYYDQDCLKIFFYPLHFQWWFKFLEKVPILAEKFYFGQKTTNRQRSRFSKVKFRPKPRIQNSANTKPLNLELLTQLTYFIFLSCLEKCFEVTETFQNFKCDGGWAKLRQEICLLRQSWTKYLAQSKEIK